MSPKYIKTQMEKHGLSREALGEMVGVSSRAIGHWITGKHSPSIMYNKKFKEVFKALNNQRQSAPEDGDCKTINTQSENDVKLTVTCALVKESEIKHFEYKNVDDLIINESGRYAEVVKGSMRVIIPLENVLWIQKGEY